MNLLGKTVLVTGGSHGIGKAIAESFKNLGAEVHIFDIEQPDESFSFSRVDLRKESEIQNAITSISQLDILVNNVGIYLSSSIDEVNEETFNKIFDTNVKSALFMSKYAMPLLKQSEGQIINISSAIASSPKPNNFLYPMTKLCLVVLTKSLAQDYQNTHVRVNALLPGPITGTSIIPNDSAGAAKNRNVPMGRLGKPQEVAQMAVHIATEATYMNGACITLDGGRSANFI